MIKRNLSPKNALKNVGTSPDPLMFLSVLRGKVKSLIYLIWNKEKIMLPQELERLRNISAEQASLGSMLISPKAVYASVESLEPDDYYKTSHSRIYRVILELFNKNVAVDLVTLTEELQNKNELIDIGGITYLTQLVNSVPTPENIEFYNRIIKEKSNQRKILFILEELKLEKIDTQKALEKISLIPIIEIKEENLKTLLKNTLKMSAKGTAHRFKIAYLNRYLGGVDKGEIITIGGFTSQGKTSLAIQLAIDFIDTDEEKRILYLSSEMTTLEISRRLLSNLMPKNIMDFRKGRFEEGEREALDSIAEIVGDRWNLNIKKVFDISDIRKYIHKYDPEIIFIDYLQNLDRKGAQTDYQRVTGNIKDIHAITLSREIATFVLSQLSRGSKDSIRKPRLSDLRDSGRIEEVSPMVIFVYWEERMQQKVEMRKGGEPPEKLEIIIAKNRDGTIGKKVLDFYPEYCQVKERKQKEYEY